MEIDSSIQGVLGQIRTLRAESQIGLNRVMQMPDQASSKVSEVADFGSIIKGALDEVNGLQKDAASKTDAFVRGESKDLVGAMLAGQRANVAFQAATQVRNRLVSAYQDIMNMPI